LKPANGFQLLDKDPILGAPGRLLHRDQVFEPRDPDVDAADRCRDGVGAQARVAARAVGLGEDVERAVRRVQCEDADMAKGARVGYERDIVAAVRAGVDMFDCVLPTRNGRNASAFTASGQIRLRNARYVEDPGPIETGCDCPACDPSSHGWATPSGRPFSRGYIRHLFMAGEMLGPILVSLHNVRFFQRLMVDIRRTIQEDDWFGFAGRWPQAAAGL